MICSKHPTYITLLALLALLIPAGALGEVTTVSLRSSVRISGDQPITLGQISTITGDQSELLRGLGIDDLFEDTAAGWERVGVDDLRTLLESEAGIHAGSVVIDGNGASVRRVDLTTLGVPSAVSNTHNNQDQADDGPVIRDHINRWVNDRYKVGDNPVRMSFRGLDLAFLQTPTSGRLLEIRELSKSGRTAMRVVLLDEFEIIAEQSIVFDVNIQRSVLVARQRINRGTILDGSHFMSEVRWVRPDEDAMDAQDAIGMAIAKTINPGQLLQTKHIELPRVIKRGELVSAKSISGSIVVTVRGRAKANARQGEIIEFESIDGKSIFMARAIGKGKALILNDR